MTINIFVLKGDLNGKNRSGAYLFLSGIFELAHEILVLKSNYKHRVHTGKYE